MGDGDRGSGGWNREELDCGKGAFFVASVTFYLTSKQTDETSESPYVPAGATPLSEFSGLQSYPPLPESAVVDSLPVHSIL